MSIPKEQLRLYLRMAAAFLILAFLGDLVEDHSKLFQVFRKGIVNNIWLVLYLVFFNYIFFEHTLPFIRGSWKRAMAAPFLIFAHLLFYSFGLYAWRAFGILLHIYFDFSSDADISEILQSLMGFSVGSVLFFGIYRHIYHYRKLQQTAQQLRIEKQEAELNFLKSQTNPHFLFNTLNNIYSLARIKSDLAPESILQLSKILRYMLYETSSAFVAIEQELKIIGDYIALERLRYDESLHVNYNYDVEDMKQALPPLLLIPLVENAFKHGVSETRNRPFVEIHLSVKQRQLRFVVKNSTENELEETPVRENIGLANLRRQLELLYREFQLILEPGEHIFTATLTINLASHV